MSNFKNSLPVIAGLIAIGIIIGMIVIGVVVFIVTFVAFFYYLAVKKPKVEPGEYKLDEAKSKNE